MEVRNCRSCKRLFNYVGGSPLCPACRDELERKFMEVKEFIRENPHCGLQEVSDAMEVSTNQLRQWVREERLEFSADSSVTLNCEKCGAPIRTGRFCEKCKGNMADTLGGLYQTAAPEPEKKKHQGDKMRFSR